MTVPIKLAASARILGGTMGDRAVSDFNVDELMALAKKLPFVNAARFDEHPPFFWRSQISSDIVDSYFTRMHESTLTAFATKATEGVSFQYSHDWTRLGLGKSLLGHFERLPAPAVNDGSEATMRTLTDFYTVPGLRMNAEMSTDDFILGVETGILFDVSVGFYAGAVKCGICGGDMYSGWFGMWGKDCNHFPGKTYKDPYIDENGNSFGGDVVCYAWIMDGVLSEVSQVYDGATPDAGHLKAQLWAESGKLDGRAIRDLERHYRMKLPGGAVLVPSPGFAGRSQAQEGDDMRVTKREAQEGDPKVTISDGDAGRKTGGENPGTGADNEELEEERAMLDDLQARFGEKGLTLAGTARQSIEQLAERVIELRDQAKADEPVVKAGKAYRKSLTDQAMLDAAAALGDSFSDETYRGIFDDASIERLERMAADFKRMADAKFPTGRQSRQENDPPKNDKESTVAPNSDDKYYK